MSVIIAFVHIIGAVIAVLALGVAVIVFGAWELKRNQKAALEEMSIALGIPVERLDDSENSSRIVQFSAARFSSDRFQNRLSDLCWWIQTAWGWLGMLIQAGLLIGVICYSITDGPSNAIYVWWVLAIAFLFLIVSIVFAYVCKLFTGRFPGQARQVRKNLAEFVKNHQTAVTHG